jgi:predicted nucleic acid-binding protein
MPRRTFLDANILIAAHRGEAVQKEAALRILTNPDRFFIASPFLALELLPKAIYNRYTAEAEFYRAYFDGVQLWISDVGATVQIAQQESQRAGLNAMDALLVAAAALGETEEFYTLESAEKPIHRTSLVHVIHLQPDW